MSKIVDQLLQLAEFIEKRKIADSDVVAAGAGYTISLHLECNVFFAVTEGGKVKYLDFGETGHGHCTVDGVPLVCVADTAEELQKLRSVGELKEQGPSLDEIPF